MDDRRYEQLEGLPVPVFALRDGQTAAANGAARALFPGWRPEDGLPAPLAGLLAGAEDPAAGLAGCCSAEGRECLAELHLAVDRLGRPVEERRDPRCDRAYFTLQRGVYRLLRMTRHLELLRQLDQEAVEQGRLDLLDLCADLTGQTEVLARQAEVAVRFESRLLALPFRGSAPHLQVMVLNLLSNAVKAAGKGGTVLVRLEREDRRAVLTVEDSGGTGPADLAALFQE